ncbi:hypothetical protein ACLOJK_014264 [Asimina triloba]
MERGVPHVLSVSATGVSAIAGCKSGATHGVEAVAEVVGGDTADGERVDAASSLRDLIISKRVQNSAQDTEMPVLSPGKSGRFWRTYSWVLTAGHMEQVCGGDIIRRAPGWASFFVFGWG